MFCSKCGKENSDDAKFCFNCGNELEVPTEEVAEESVEEVEEEKANEVGEGETAIVEQKSVELDEQESEIEEPQPKKKKVGWIVALVAIGVFVFWMINSGMMTKKDTTYPIVYLKEDGIFVRDEKKEKSVEIAQDIFENRETEESTYYLQRRVVKMTEDGQKMFYLTNIEDDDYNCDADLYYSDVTYNKIKDKKGENIGTEVVTNIAFPYFEISKDGSMVAYLKNREDDLGSLYINDFKEEEKISSDVRHDFTFSEDHKQILYSTYKDDEKQYWIAPVKTEGKKEKIDSDINQILLYTSNFEKIYYNKIDDEENGTISIYMKEKGKDKVKLASDVYEVNGINENGNIIYSKRKKVDLGFDELIDDDLKSTDANMKYPDLDDFISGYEENYYGYSYPVYDYDAYYAAEGEYEEKLYRDEIREGLKEYPIPFDLFDVYGYGPDGEKKIDSNVYSVYEVSDDAKSVLYLKNGNENGEIKKIKISKIEDYEDFDKFHCENNFKKVNIFLATSGEEPKKALSIEDQDEVIDVETDFKSIYVIKDYDDEESGGKLVKYNIANSDEKEVIDKDVTYFEIIDDSRIVYKKGKEKDERTKYDLYLKAGEQKEKIAENIKDYFIAGDKNIIVCLEDYSYDKERGSLVLINKFEKTTLAEDVYDFFYRDINSILYRVDYNQSKNRGELWLYNGQEKNTKIDDDVTHVLMY